MTAHRPNAAHHLLLYGVCAKDDSRLLNGLKKAALLGFYDIWKSHSISEYFSVQNKSLWAQLVPIYNRDEFVQLPERALPVTHGAEPAFPARSASVLTLDVD